MKNLWDLWPSSNLPQSSSLPHWLYFLFPGLGKCFPGSSCYLLWVFAQLSSPVIVFLITLFKIFLSIPTLQPQHPHPCYLLYFLSVLFVFDLFFGCVGLHCYVGSFSSCGRPGPLSSRGTRASRCRGFSCFGAWALGRTGFRNCCGLSHCSSRAPEHRLSRCVLLLQGMWDLPLPGIQADSSPLSHQGSPLLWSLPSM